VSARKGREESLKAINQRGANETVMVNVVGEVSAREGREGLDISTASGRHARILLGPLCALIEKLPVLGSHFVIKKSERGTRSVVNQLAAFLVWPCIDVVGSTDQHP
ncbi:MAG: hypothetical protein L0K77_10135, partial [Bifidobacterium crudilactis]|jgi:hypothetical protein|uniref:hypothetical protein n=1 Tax=Bifidobacterium crudilactis TaxID=327277 RepID=UPI002648CBD4